MKKAPNSQVEFVRSEKSNFEINIDETKLGWFNAANIYQVGSRYTFTVGQKTNSRYTVVSLNEIKACRGAKDYESHQNMTTQTPSLLLLRKLSTFKTEFLPVMHPGEVGGRTPPPPF